MAKELFAPRVPELARALLACEARAGDFSQLDLPAAFRVIQKLSSALIRLFGTVGFHSLMARALRMVKAQEPGLPAVQLNEDGSIAAHNLNQPEQVAEASVMLIAQLLDLLVNFIGEGITEHLLYDIWPDFHGPDRDVLEEK